MNHRQRKELAKKVLARLRARKILPGLDVNFLVQIIETQDRINGLISQTIDARETFWSA